jgi:outer membrane receptor protein involved in Fe transport
MNRSSGRHLSAMRRVVGGQRRHGIEQVGEAATALNQGSTQSVDASLSFKVIDNISLTADAVNLTNDKIFQYAGTTDRFRALYDNGRQFYLGVRVGM